MIEMEKNYDQEKMRSRIKKTRTSSKSNQKERRDNWNKKKGLLSYDLVELVVPMLIPFLESKQVMTTLRLVNREWVKTVQNVSKPLDIVLCGSRSRKRLDYVTLRYMSQKGLLRVCVRISENSNVSKTKLGDMLKDIGCVNELDCGENESLVSTCLQCIHHSSIRILGLARVGLKPSHKISKYLKRTPNLEILKLEGNLLSTEGAKSVSLALEFLPKLKRLNLSDNKIGPGGGIALSAQLKHVRFFIFLECVYSFFLFRSLTNAHTHTHKIGPSPRTPLLILK